MENLVINANNKTSESSSPYAIFGVLTIAVLIILGFVGYNAVKTEMQNNISSLLQLNLSANLTALKAWIEDIKHDAEEIASEPKLLETIYSLLEIPKQPNLPDIQIQQQLKESQELIWLRKRLSLVCKLHGF